MTIPHQHFKTDFAPHLGLTSLDSGTFVNHAGTDPLAQIRFMHDMGFKTVEDNFLKARSVEEQIAMGELLASLNMKLGTFVATFETTTMPHEPFAPDAPSFAYGDINNRQHLMNIVKEAAEAAKRVDAKMCTVLSGPFSQAVPTEYQTANVIENLKWCADIAAEAGLTLGLEPINARQWTGTFVTTIPHGYLISKAVDHPNVKLIFDAYHVQIETGSVIENLDAAYDQVAYIQIADVPGRNQPGSGEMNYANILRHLSQKGYEGVVAIEHGNTFTGCDGEMALVETLLKLDSAIHA